MFGIGFFEVLLILLIALMVMGPKRMPELIRSTALWVGRLKRKVADFRQQIEEEIGADEIKQILHNEKVLQELDQAKNNQKEESVSQPVSSDNNEYANRPK